MRDRTIKKNQQGLVSIIITLIIMLVLSLILLGFSQLARREQRQALDRQLSAQALFAAESGLNAATKFLMQPGNANYEKSACGEDASGLKGYSDLDSGAGQVEVTCLLVTQKNTTIPVNNVVENKSTVVDVQPSGTPASLKIEWSDSGSPRSTSVNTDTGLPKKAVWGTAIGMLRIDLVPRAGFSKSTAAGSSFTAFLRPSSGGATPTVGFATNSSPANYGKIQTGSCTADGLCSLSIDSIPASAAGYAMRLSSVYNSVNVVVSGKDGSGNTLTFSGTPQVDVTGRAGDVLRRVRTRISTSSLSSRNDVFPGFAIDSAGGICKQIKIAPAPEIPIDACGPPGSVPSPGDTPIVVSTATPDPLAGQVDFGSGCGRPDCSAPAGSGPGTQFYYDNATDPGRWQAVLENKTVTPAGLTNVGCVWNISDGTIIENRYCNQYDGFIHTLPQDATQCLTYSVTLTVQFSNGTTDTRTHTYIVPYNNPLPGGTYQFPGPCSNP